MKFQMVAPCLFGVESIAAQELRRMGAETVEAQNGRVLFSGDDAILARANLGARCCERILIAVGSFRAVSFDQLFEGVKALPWEELIRKDDAFPVNGWSLNSQLASIPDCQSIIKKAIVERMKSRYRVSWFPETAAMIRVRFSILKDEVTVMIDTSGEGLHKRGYRKNSNAAPLKETLAAALCDLARIYPDTLMLDPFCGSGTLLIESALIATHTAPGLNRYFAAERYPFIRENAFREERSRAMDAICRDVEFRAVGSDLDPAAVELTAANAKKAGVERYIEVKTADVRQFTPPQERCTLITNPPYGERLLDVREAEELYRVMGTRFVRGNGQKYSVISPDDQFEKCFGATADKRRKLYNGMIKCQLFQYFRKDTETDEKQK